ncbi:hypothetical protein GCM10023238_10700 [Streptomyces heliomycini]
MHPHNALRRRLLLSGAASLAAATVLPGTAHARDADAMEPDIDSTADWGARSRRGPSASCGTGRAESSSTTR